MPIATHTFRVFVSSTFEDLKLERDALQREVFPKLRTLCEQHGARFQAIDLRWGVRDEAALDQQTLEICLREIRRCQATGVRPNFIVLLGDRYGWRPLPPRIPAAEFDTLMPHMLAGDARAQAEQWYKLDENAVPPEYCLQPRTGEFIDPDAWNAVEQTLRHALARAARAVGPTERGLNLRRLWSLVRPAEAAREVGLTKSGLLRYEASATHLEIMAGLGETKAERQHVFGFFRRPVREADARLEELKSYLRSRLPGNVAEFDPGDTMALCDAVFEQLRQVIEAEVKCFEDRPVLDLEVEAHDRFAEDRSRIFTGRQAVLDTIAVYISGDDRRPLVMHGESGSGKSAVMAKASEQYKGPGRVIRRFIGASPESASGHALLTSLCRQIAPGETPVDYATLEEAFRERLSAGTEQQPLVLFIDALDQLAANDPARDVTWLPPELPPNVKVILSTANDGERLPDGMPVRLERMPQAEGEQALTELLHEAHRTLQPWQRETVLAHFERCGLPLYLKMAAEESRLWKSYTPHDACKLGEGVLGVIDTLFDRLASNANHGPVLVERSLGYIAAARYGLTEDEVLDVLTADDAVWTDFDQRKHHEVSDRRLPVVVWSRLSLDLEPYLTEHAAPGGTVIAFYHRQLADSAGVWSQDRHSDLARYFVARPVADTRRLVELPFQQRGAHQWTEAEATLFHCPFLFAKAAADMVLDLAADYQELLQESRAGSLPRREALQLIQGALQLSMHVVALDPAQFASQMVGRLLAHRDKPDVPKFVDEIIASAPGPWFRPLHPCFDAPGGALLRTLEGHTSWVQGVALALDGKLAVSASLDKTLKVWDLGTGLLLRTLECHSDHVYGVALAPNGELAVSASADKTLKVWDLDTGRVLLTLEGHSEPIEGVAVTPDGKRAVSACANGWLRVWDLNTGRTLLTLKEHSGFVCGVAVTPDGRRAVSASWDKTLKVWDLDTGGTLFTLEGHSGHVCGVAVTPDGTQAISASQDRTLKVWDLGSGLALRTLLGHSAEVWGVAVTPDGTRAVSASQDRTLKVWDLEASPESRTPEGQSDWVYGVAATPDGKRAVSSSSHDTALKLWDMHIGCVLRTLEGHSGPVLGFAVTPNGKRVISSSEDRTLKVWDLDSGSVLRTLKDSSDGISEIAVTPDGKRAVSASSKDNALKLWDLLTGRVLRALEGHSRPVGGVAITSDGRRAVSASWDHTLRLWDLDTGGTLSTLEGHSAEVCGVAVTPDGKRAISASEDKTLRVWDLNTGRALCTLDGHSAQVWGVAVTPDGQRAISASRDKTLKVWDLEIGLLVASFHCEAGARCCACADKRRVVAGDEGGRIYFLSLEE